MSEEELLPCPFCGGSAAVENNGTCMGLYCQHCGTGWEYQICDYLTIDQRKADTVSGISDDGLCYEEKHAAICRNELIKSWNTRATPPLTDEMIEKGAKALGKFEGPHSYKVNIMKAKACLTAALGKE